METDAPVPVADPFLILADDWPGAWDALDFERPDDWREVAAELAWDVAAVCGAWVYLEAHHQDRARTASLRRRAQIVADTLRDDLPFMVDVGPSSPAGPGQPQLPLLLGDDPGLERLSDRAGDMSWRTYFALPLHLRTDLVLHRTAATLRKVWMAERGIEVAGDGSTEEAIHAIRERFGPAIDFADIQRWVADREREDRDLVDHVGGQVALQIECLLRKQVPTVLPLVEEGLALHLEDAALGAALHVRVDGAGRPVGLCLVSYDGRPRAVLTTSGEPETDLRQLVAAVGS